MAADDKKKKSWLKWILAALGIIGFVFILFISLFLIVPLMLIIAIGFLFGGAQDGAYYDSGNVALIEITGVIQTQGEAELFDLLGVTTSDYVVDTLKKLKEDNDIKGVIISINSPGGSGVASEEIAHAIRELDKPTVSYIREMGASGAYWVASATDHIFASRLSVVGSIGVTGSYLEFSGLLDRYNVTYQRFVAGEKKDFGSVYRPPTEEERRAYQAMLDENHEIFISEVAEGRKMNASKVRALADGSIYTGGQAVELGLVDKIGSYEDAKAYMEQVLGTNATVVPYKKSIPFLESFFSVLSKPIFSLGLGVGAGLAENRASRAVIT